MAVYRKYGINPLLIQIITGKEISELPESPSVASLPGKYAKKIAETMDEKAISKPKNSYTLTCRNCGRNGKYDLGRIVVDPEIYNDTLNHDEAIDERTSSIESFQFMGYFRCHYCNAAGQWAMPNFTKTMLHMALLGNVLSSKAGIDGEKITFGKVASGDGQTYHLVTDLEDRYLADLQREPGNAWIWNRLGNAYYKGGRPDLAVVAYEESIKYDPAQMESHYSLGRILSEQGEEEAAVTHLRRMLLTAPGYDRLEPLDLRDILTEGLHIAMDVLDDPEEFVSFLPKAGDFAEYKAETGRNIKTVNLNYVELDISFDEFVGIYPLAEIYMGESRKELPVKERTLFLPEMKPNQVIHPKKKRPPKKKGNKKK